MIVGEAADALTAAREAYASRDWPRALDRFATARNEDAALTAGDLDALSDAAWWLGRVDESIEAADAAYRAYLADGRRSDAVMSALETAVSLFLRGDESSGSGWMARAQRLLADLPDGSPEHGYVRYILEVEGGLDGGDLEAVAAAARDVQAIGERHDEPNLTALGVLGEGRALVRLGTVERGLELLDEAMLGVGQPGLAPEWAGNIYCHLMAACHELGDITRARQWTEATWQWLEELPAAVLFTGICRVHRSQVHQVTGEWDRAESEATQVLDDLAGVHVASVAEAHYQLGELARLRGELDAAVDSYMRARELGRDPQPGLGLLRLAQGRIDDAVSGVGAAMVAVGPDQLARAMLCQAQVEVALAAGDLELARRACAELEDTAAAYGTSGLEAAALHWRGAVALAEDRPEEALPALRAACQRWHAARAAYRAAKACVLLGRSYAALGDRDSAAAEFDTAREAFRSLGASVDVGEVERLRDRISDPSETPGGLTDREVEVLALVAHGMTNREAADELVLSDKTIARHLSNIYGKLGVSTRTEAAAFAFEHGLADLQPPAGRG